MCYFNRLTRVDRWLADYPEWLQFCWDFVKPPRNDKNSFATFFSLLAAVQEFFSISFHFYFQQALEGNFFSKSPIPPSPPPPPPQELNSRPLNWASSFFSFAPVKSFTLVLEVSLTLSLAVSLMLCLLSLLVCDFD